MSSWHVMHGPIDAHVQVSTMQHDQLIVALHAGAERSPGGIDNRAHRKISVCVENAHMVIINSGYASVNGRH